MTVPDIRPRPQVPGRRMVAAGSGRGPLLQTRAAACEAVWSFLGIEAPCGAPAIGLFSRACAHEHVRTGRLCRDHADTPERGLCQACWDLPGGLAHECPIGLAESSNSPEGAGQ